MNSTSSPTLTYVSQMLVDLAKLLEQAGHLRFAEQLRKVQSRMAKRPKARSG